MSFEYKKNGAGDVFRKKFQNKKCQCFFRKQWCDCILKDVWDLPNMIHITEKEAIEMVRNISENNC